MYVSTVCDTAIGITLKCFHTFCLVLCGSRKSKFNNTRKRYVSKHVPP